MLQNLRLVSRLDARPLAFLEIFCGFFPLPSSASSSFSLFFFLGVLVYFFSFLREDIWVFRCSFLQIIGFR